MHRHQVAGVVSCCGWAVSLLAICGSTSWAQQPAWQRNRTAPKPPVAKVAQPQADAKPQAAVEREGSVLRARQNPYRDTAFTTSASAARQAVKPASTFADYEEVIPPTPAPMQIGSTPCGDGSCELGYPYEIGCGCEPCGDPCGCCEECGMGCGCGDCCYQPGCTQPGGCLGGCAERGCVPLMLFVPPITDAVVFGGVQGFKSPLDQGRDRGNFGFHEGLNLGGKMGWLPVPGLGYQIGYQAMQNQLSGDSLSESSDSHTQQFVTAGLFRRNCAGFQGGLVYDWMRDERIESADFSQIRGELGLRNPRGHEIGFTFAVHLDDSELESPLAPLATYQSTDWYLLYYRVQGDRAGEIRGFAGFDDGDRGVLGGDFLLPLDNRWSIQGGFVYYIPDGSENGVGATEEGWNLGLNIVWNYGCRAKTTFKSIYRPMFNVADNGTMFIDDRP